MLEDISHQHQNSHELHVDFVVTIRALKVMMQVSTVHGGT